MSVLQIIGVVGFILTIAACLGALAWVLTKEKVWGELLGLMIPPIVVALIITGFVLLAVYGGK